MALICKPVPVAKQAQAQCSAQATVSKASAINAPPVRISPTSPKRASNSLEASAYSTPPKPNNMTSEPACAKGTP